MTMPNLSPDVEGFGPASFEFPAARYALVGVAPADIATLEAEFALLTPDQQFAWVQAAAGLSNGDLYASATAQAAAASSTVGQQTVAQVLAAVGTDPVAAAAALQIEEAGQNRSTLVAALQKIIAQTIDVQQETEVPVGDATPPGDGSFGGVEGPVDADGSDGSFDADA